MSLLDLDSVSVRRGRTEVVREVSLALERGEVLAILGPNGTGKSTLLESIGGLLEPSAGTISRNGRVATVMQSPGLARRSVRANVELALRWWGVPRAQRRERTAEALEKMRATHLTRRRADQLSGGEQRRVHVARGLALRADLLLLDEPFAGLDPQSRALLCDDTASVLRSSESGAVVVVHDRDEAWALADRLLVMLDGRVAALGTPRDLLTEPPDPEVAVFLGYDGRLESDGEILLTRPPHVRVHPNGDREATVSRVVRRQDGVELALELIGGTVRARHDDVGVRVGDRVRLSIVGGRRFPGDE